VAVRHAAAAGVAARRGESEQADDDGVIHDGDDEDDNGAVRNVAAESRFFTRCVVYEHASAIDGTARHAQLFSHE
jgi:hypothetical protein